MARWGRSGLVVGAAVAVLASMTVPGTSAEAQSSPPSCDTPPANIDDPFLLPAWTDANGWTDPSQYETVVSGDVNGDGTYELMGRTSAGMEVQGWAPAPSAGEAAPNQWMSAGQLGPPWSTADGWDNAIYYSTIQTADLDGNGDDELVARGAAGIQAYDLSGTDLVTAQWQALPNGPAWSDAAGWTQEWSYSTIQSGDVDGDGTDELLGLEPAGTTMAVVGYDASTGSWTTLPSLGLGTGWTAPAYYPSIQVADLDGDGADEVLARSAAGVEAFELANGAWSVLPAGPGWSDAAGWDQPEQVQTIQTADLDGDGTDDLIGLSDAGVAAYAYDGGAWNLMGILNEFPSSTWAGVEYYSTLQTGDIDGDGAAELVARGPDGLEAFALDAGTWVPAATTFSTLSDDGGWNAAVRYPTIDVVPVESGQPEVLIARSNMGVNTWLLSGTGASATWVPASTGFPYWTETPTGTPDASERAFAHINQKVGDVLWPDDTGQTVLTQLENTSLLVDIQSQLAQVRPEGLNITREEWDAVYEPVTSWVDAAVAVDSYLLGSSPSLNSLALDQLMLTTNYLTDIDNTYFSTDTGEEILAIVSTVLAGVLSAAASVVDPAVLPLLVVGLSLLSSGLSSWQGFVNPEGAITAEYGELAGQIDDIFCYSSYFLFDAYDQIVGDYGLLVTAGMLVGDGTWGWVGSSSPGATNPYDEAVSQMAVGQQVWVFQQLGSVAWRAGYCNPNAFGDWICGFAAGGPTDDPNAYTVPGTNTVQWQAVGTLLGGVDCLTQPDDAWTFLQQTLGVDLADVFAPLDSDGLTGADYIGTNGWNLKVDTCNT